MISNGIFMMTENRNWVKGLDAGKNKNLASIP
jgi:hypothetical protein